MASLSFDSKGARLHFVLNRRKRKSIRLGDKSEGEARAAKQHVEHLIECAAKRRPWAPATADWLDELRERRDPLLDRLIEYA
jgi:hypothetical protein